MYYPKEKVNEAKAQFNLAVYIEQRTGSRAVRAGQGYFINPCPFCGHKNHFFVNEDKGLFRSFSPNCDYVSGDIITFIEKYEQVSRKEALYRFMEMVTSNMSKSI
ncbi:CHC2 zinc finger domain-containing protein [uncultured Anoxybacillus sp.]|uniref:CHC2 zinc finger domain-containing protein n=1 Tax=uncultured Anoxybacillus sp. TaxID=263860 RepID=UPI0026259EBA|nr:CHC2 zinc finger domain-containing protein [uncultured Anoxybacillus sp.]